MSPSDIAFGTLPWLLSPEAGVELFRSERRTSSILLRRLSPSQARNGTVGHVLDDVDEVTAHWPYDLRFKLVWVVELIAEAERARDSWNPKVLGEAYRAVASEGMKSAKLAKQLLAGFPEPSPINSLVQQLRAFTSAALNKSITLDCDLAVWVASKTLSEFRADQTDQTKAISNILLADLVVVALGGAIYKTFDESTIRKRYRHSPTDKASKTSTPAARVWREGWNDLKELAKCAAAAAARMSEQDRSAAAALYESQREEFGAAIRARLGPDSED